MKKITSVIILSLFCSLLLTAQTCFPGGLILSNQADIDNFQINNPNCTEIEGFVWIYGDQIVDLNGLNTITSIGGYLKIEQTNLTSLSGLDELTMVGGDLEIGVDLFQAGNPLLEDLDGLNKLENIGGRLLIQWNPSLNNVDGLESLTTLKELILYENLSLDNLDGFKNLTSIENNFYLWFCGLKNLSGLEKLSSVGGDFQIDNNLSLTSIAEVSNLSFIGRDLEIEDNIALTSLTGLENITSIVEDLGITYNEVLVDLNGLKNLRSVGERLDITDNDILLNLKGLENLDSVGNWLDIQDNESLISLDGLDNLKYVGGNLEIQYNPELTSLNGIENLRSVHNYIWINGNPKLISIEALNDLETDPVRGLAIKNNPLLSECAIAMVCEFINTSDEFLDIEGNAVGCNSKNEVKEACDALVYCYPEGLVFTSQDEIDNFPVNNPGCIEIVGDIILENSNIRNVDGLNNLTALGGDLILNNNDQLENLIGLINLVSIGGNLEIINNDILTDLTGLENIDPGSIQNLIVYDNDILVLCDVEPICSYIENPVGNIDIHNNGIGCNSAAEVEDFCTFSSSCFPDGYIFTSQAEIDYFSASFPNCIRLEGNLIIEGGTITNLDGLNVLISIGGNLEVKNNPLLEDISGLINIDPGSIQDLSIFNNPLLTICEIENLCTYISSPNGTVDIHDNAIGCNSMLEVENKCTTATIDLFQGSKFKVYPNPARNEVFVVSFDPSLKIDLSIFNHLGQIVLVSSKINAPLDISSLKPGLYFLEIFSGDSRTTMKLVVE